MFNLRISCFKVYSNFSDLERSYIISKANLEKANHILDSLKIVLNAKASQIDYEKSKKNADSDKIKEMMSSSVLLSNTFELQQKKVNQIEKKIQSIINDLSKKYTSIIDSLQALRNSKEIDGDTKYIDSKVLFYTEKILLRFSL